MKELTISNFLAELALCLEKNYINPNKISFVITYDEWYRIYTNIVHSNMYAGISIIPKSNEFQYLGFKFKVKNEE